MPTTWAELLDLGDREAAGVAADADDGEPKLAEAEPDDRAA